MDAYFVGQGQFLGGEEASASSAHGNSLAVRQFLELARGERRVQKPRNGFRTQAVKAEERYCLGCYGVRRHDAWYGLRKAEVKGMGLMEFGFSMAWCRCCGKES